MEINVVLTEMEKEFLISLVNMGSSFNYYSDNDPFRKRYKKEIEEFTNNGLIKHCNSHDYDAYIRIGLTKLGEETAFNYGLTHARAKI